jgi:ribosomal protein L28
MRVCAICKKGSLIQKSGAHQYGGGWAMRATKKRAVWQVNLHNVKVKLGNGSARTMRLCTKCLRKVKGEMQKEKNKIIQDSSIGTDTPPKKN